MRPWLPSCASRPFAPVVINPYACPKLMVEQILADLVHADAQWQVRVLRYFNPVGAHASGLIGEDAAGIPNNMMPFIAQVAVGHRERLAVFGNDHSTPDGTGVRDYIHVVDLALGHVAALNRLFSLEGGFTVNLGTGHGYSVLDTVRAFEAASGRAVPYDILPRRLATSPAAMPRPTRRRNCWAGRRRNTSMTCVPITGAGSTRIRKAMRPEDSLGYATPK